MNERTNERMNEGASERTNKQTNEQMKLERESSTEGAFHDEYSNVTVLSFQKKGPEKGEEKIYL